MRIKTAILCLIVCVPGCDGLTHAINTMPSETQPAATPPEAPGSSVSDFAEIADTYGPDILALLGAAGVPCVGLGAVMWRKRRIASDLVKTVQAGLDTLVNVQSRGPDGKFVNARRLMTAELKKQSKPTSRFVEKTKEKMHEIVTRSNP